MLLWNRPTSRCVRSIRQLCRPVFEKPRRQLVSNAISRVSKRMRMCVLKGFLRGVHSEGEAEQIGSLGSTSYFKPCRTAVTTAANSTTHTTTTTTTTTMTITTAKTATATMATTTHSFSCRIPTNVLFCFPVVFSTHQKVLEGSRTHAS